MLEAWNFLGSRLIYTFGWVILYGSLCVLPPVVQAAGQAGDIVQTDMLGTNVWTENLDTGKVKTIGDSFGLSEFVGLHYYFMDDVRVGMAFQFTETVAPPPPAGVSDFTTFALLPQVGWNFAKPFFAQLTVAVPLRTDGVNQVDFGLQGVFGASLPLSDRLSANLALEIPVYLKLEHTIGLTPLAGIGWKL